MNMPDRQRWQRLSPLLDELLDLAPAQQALRLGALLGEHPTLAGELAALHAAHQRAGGEHFLEDAAADAATEAAPPTLAGQRLGPYTLVAPLGHGGTGSVWRAHRNDGRFDAQVAVKLLHLSLVGHAPAQRFRREGSILARLTHPNIAHLLDAGVSDGGQPYLVLEWVDGERIDHHCDHQRLSVEQRLSLFDDVLAAVSHAHSHLVIHRDIKPTNILVDRQGQVKLLDFGIAKILEDQAWNAEATAITREGGGQSLTPEYAAPEQWRGEPVTTATDVYALGVLLYQLLAGRHPTAADHATVQQVMQATLESEPARLSAACSAEAAALRETTLNGLTRRLRGDLSNIVARALAKAPPQRYPTVDALAEDLRRHRNHEPVTARAHAWPYRWGKFARRHRVMVGAGALSTAAVVAGLAGTLSQARVAEYERDRALRQLVQTEAVEEFLGFLISTTANRPLSTLELLDRAREMANAQFAGNPAVRARLQLTLADLYGEIDAQDATLELLAQAGVAAQQAGDIDLQAQAECAKAAETGLEPDSKRAAARFEQAMAMLRAQPGSDTVALAYCHHVRAIRAFDLGENLQAMTDEREALALMGASRPGNRALQVAMRQGLAGALAKTGDLALAIEQIQAAIDELKAMGRSNTIGVQTLLNNKGVLFSRAGDPLRALAAFNGAIGDLHDGTTASGAASFGNRARALLDIGRVAEAQQALAQGLALAAERGDSRSPPFSIASFGWCAPGELPRCEQRIEAARDSMAALLPPSHASLGYADISHARMLLDAGQPERAKPLLERAVSIYGAPERGEPARIRALTLLARAELQLGRVETALEVAERAVQQARSAAVGFNHSEWLGSALLAQGSALRARGDAQASAAVLHEALAQLVPTVGDEAPSVIEVRRLLATH
ncbi:MAG TPA: serine/threonine-protein kinase [Ideonella sp.]|uniref:serine/threonine-protein kinase n=1 Tax=Ideonella sp. TaxID=1929293 RepID=UPI002E32D754|nr:serine/threonine-protein kinase [Ideonella sp.]HEX5685909.1 serine/threonine-protein kinase [Ideonella sp.]